MKSVFVLFAYHPEHFLDSEEIENEDFLGVFADLDSAKESVQRMWEEDKRIVEVRKLDIHVPDYCIEEFPLEENSIIDRSKSLRTWERRSYNDDGDLEVVPWEEIKREYE